MDIYIYIYINIYIYIYICIFIYTLSRRLTINTNLRKFQYKLLHSILYLNKTFHKFGKSYPYFAFFQWKILQA